MHTGRNDKGNEHWIHLRIICSLVSRPRAKRFFDLGHEQLKQLKHHRSVIQSPEKDSIRVLFSGNSWIVMIISSTHTSHLGTRLFSLVHMVPVGFVLCSLSQCHPSPVSTVSPMSVTVHSFTGLVLPRLRPFRLSLFRDCWASMSCTRPLPLCYHSFLARCLFQSIYF